MNAAADNELTPLMMAAYGQSSEVMTALLQNGADPDAVEQEMEDTPLMIAVRTGILLLGFTNIRLY